MDRFCRISDSFFAFAWPALIFLLAVLPLAVVRFSYCVTFVRFTPVRFAVEAEVLTAFFTLLLDPLAAVFFAVAFFPAAFFAAVFFAAGCFPAVFLLTDFF